MAFQQALSGLNAATKFLEAIGNNVANANTVGFKNSRAEFADMFAQAVGGGNQAGIGGRTIGVTQQFTQGNVTSTGNPLDLALTGQGMFKVRKGTIEQPGETAYTRNGQFKLNSQGYIVNGETFLYAYKVNENGDRVGDDGPIQIDNRPMAPRATGASTKADAGLNASLNLPANSPVITRGTSLVSFNSTVIDATTQTYNTRVTDSTGKFHTLALTLTPDPAGAVNNILSYTVTGALDGGTAITLPNKLRMNTATGAYVDGSDQKASFSLAPTGLASGNTPFNFTVNLAGLSFGTLAAGTFTGNDSKNGAVLNLSNVNLDANDPAGTVRTFAIQSGSLIGNSATAQTVTVTLTKAADGPTGSWNAAYTVGAAAPIDLSPITFSENRGVNGGARQTVTIDGIPVVMNFEDITQKTQPFAIGTTEVRSQSLVSNSDPATYTASTNTTVYDSLGNPHTLTLYLTKVGVNTWELQTSTDGQTPVIQEGYVTFDNNGRMTGGGSKLFSIDPNAATSQSGNGANTPLQFSINLGTTSQYGSTFSVSSLAQDGFAEGQLIGLSVASDGMISGRFSNNQTVKLAQVGLYNFTNQQGLIQLGDNLLAQSAASGAPRPGFAGKGEFGAIQPAAVEDSNVDLAKELVDMITAQRTYQANTQSIRTQDQILQALINLR